MGNDGAQTRQDHVYCLSAAPPVRKGGRMSCDAVLRHCDPVLLGIAPTPTPKRPSNVFPSLASSSNGSWCRLGRTGPCPSRSSTRLSRHAATYAVNRTGGAARIGLFRPWPRRRSQFLLSSSASRSLGVKMDQPSSGRRSMKMASFNVAMEPPVEASMCRDDADMARFGKKQQLRVGRSKKLPTVRQ